MQPLRRETIGLWFGLAGVVGFSLTLPATRIAVSAFDPLMLTLGRALGASVLAIAALGIWAERRPTWAEWRSLALVTGGVILGFPLLSAWAMRDLPASHGAVMLGLLPLASAAAAALRAGERPSRRFWMASAAGSLVVAGFSLRQGAGQFHTADLLLLGAVLAAAVGYAEGGRLARTLGSWQVICWALVLAAPFVAVPLLFLVMRADLGGPPDAWLAFGYLAAVSQFGAFVAWYKGMGVAGVARTTQLQLLQPFLTVVASAPLLGEPLAPETLIAATLVVGTVVIARRAPVLQSQNAADA